MVLQGHSFLYLLDENSSIRKFLDSSHVCLLNERYDNIFYVYESSSKYSFQGYFSHVNVTLENKIVWRASRAIKRRRRRSGASNE